MNGRCIKCDQKRAEGADTELGFICAPCLEAANRAGAPHCGLCGWTEEDGHAIRELEEDSDLLDLPAGAHVCLTCAWREYSYGNALADSARIQLEATNA